MIAQRSDLVLENFCVVNTKCTIVPPKNEDVEFNPIANTEKCPVDINFDVEKENGVERYRILVKVDINSNEEHEGGYAILAEGIGFFSFNEESNISDKDKAQLIQTSALSICITNLRLYIANQTSYYPWGSFTFHAVDVNKLIQEKINQLPVADKEK